MGKTYKDTANFHRFKDTLENAPKHIREKGELMESKYKGYRFGDDRKSNANSKVVECRKERRRLNRGEFPKHSSTLK